MGAVTALKYEFARVFCSSTSWPYLGDVVYREYVAVSSVRRDESIKKVESWENKALPPSVVMIGIDSLSRMNYYRSFPQTKAFLDGIGAVELLGYTKGEVRGH